MEFNVYNGEYPFDQLLGVVAADTAEEALQLALQAYGKLHPHCVVGPREN